MADYFRRTFGEGEASYLATRRFLFSIAEITKDSDIFGAAVQAERCKFTTRAPDSRNVDAGIFAEPSVEQLRALVIAQRVRCADTAAAQLKSYKATFGAVGVDGVGATTICNVVGEARHQHLLAPGTVIQAASQFNYLEFPSERTTPEAGITNYMYDRTQGPACAIACAAGTAFRNYLAFVMKPGDPMPLGTDLLQEDLRGQLHNRQFDGLADVTAAIQARGGASVPPYYAVVNGYVDSSTDRLVSLNALFTSIKHEEKGSHPPAASPALDTLTDHGEPPPAATSAEDASVPSPHEGGGVPPRPTTSFREMLISKLKIGVQWDTQVTDSPDALHPVHVTQTYNSAISIGYSRAMGWDELARIVLDASYEATLLVAALKVLRSIASSGRSVDGPCVYLTQVGGGVFGNDHEWILAAIRRGCTAVENLAGIPLRVAVLHYGAVHPLYERLSTSR